MHMLAQLVQTDRDRRYSESREQTYKVPSTSMGCPLRISLHRTGDQTSDCACVCIVAYQLNASIQKLQKQTRSVRNVTKNGEERRIKRTRTRKNPQNNKL